MYDDDCYESWEPLDDMEEWERTQLANDNEGFDGSEDDDLNWDDDFDGPLGDDMPDTTLDPNGLRPLSDYEADTPLGREYGDGCDLYGDGQD